MITITDDVKAFKTELDAAKNEEERAIKALHDLAASGCQDNDLLNLKIKEMVEAHNKKMDLMETEKKINGTLQS